MSTAGPVMQGRRPILLMGDIGPQAPVIRRSLDELGRNCHEIRSVPGSEALPRLRRLSLEAPSIVLLVIAEPSGTELSLLKGIKEDEQLRSLPVVVLGPPNDAWLVKESFGLGAAGYMANSADPRELTAVMHTVGRYWNLNRLPRQA